MPFHEIKLSSVAKLRMNIYGAPPLGPFKSAAAASTAREMVSWLEKRTPRYRNEPKS